MRKLLNLNNIILCLFIALQIFAEFVVFCKPLRIFELRIHQYIIVVITLLFSLLYIKKPHLHHLAFIFILIADLFLTLLRPQLINEGLIFFLFAQVIFAVAIYIDQKEKTKLPILIARLSISIIGGIIVGIVSKGNSTLILTTIYGVNLITNIISSFTKNKIDWLLSIGLVLFMLCDISIGLNAGISMGLFPEKGNWLYNFAAAVSFNTGWFWYIPCLTLLSLDTIKLNKQK